MKISEIKDTLKAELLVGEDQLDKNIVAAGGADLMADVLSAVAQEAVLLTKYSLFVASGRLYINGLRGLDGSW